MENTHRIYFDIETLPAIDWTDARISAHIEASVPKNLKKAETIEKWKETKGQEKFHKTGTDWRHGRVLCISAGIDDLPIETVWADYRTGDAVDCDEVEAKLIENFEAMLDARLHTAGRHTADWVGHNIIGFDLPWLYYRALKYGVDKLARLMPFIKFDRRIYDTQQRWLGPNYSGNVKLDDICTYLGLLTKEDSGMHGSEVYQAWLDKRDEEIRLYCEDDVERLRQVVRVLDRGEGVS